MYSLSSQRAAQTILDSLAAPHQQHQHHRQHRQQAPAVNPCHAWPRTHPARRAATSHQPAAAVWRSTAPEVLLPRGKRAPKNARPVPRAALCDAGERSRTCGGRPLTAAWQHVASQHINAPPGIKPQVRLGKGMKYCPCPPGRCPPFPSASNHCQHFLTVCDPHAEPG